MGSSGKTFGNHKWLERVFLSSYLCLISEIYLGALSLKRSLVEDKNSLVEDKNWHQTN